jgi:predicted nucleic acid-binding protein
LARKPEKGDYVTCQMKSGKVGVFQVVKVDHCRDPDDMFFADVKPLGYADEMNIPDEAPSKTGLMLS